MRVQGSASICLGIVALLIAGCGGSQTTASTGTAELRVDTSLLESHDVTLVVVEASGVSEELALDPATGAYVGSLVLPVGSHELVARAYAGATEVGASEPTAVEIMADVVTRVTLRILDTTGGEQPDFGPIITSLVHPASAEVGATVTFSVVAVDPDDDPVSLAWTDDCADSTFTDAQAATTGWSKASPGTCRVTVTASSNELSASESFSIVVFPSSVGSGAVDVDGVFVAAPIISLDLSYGSYGCQVYPTGENASCAGSTAAPEQVHYTAYVSSWGISTPGSIELLDSCGGSSVVDLEDPNVIYGRWLPPTQGEICRITARAVNGDGVPGRIAAALLVRDGSAAPPAAPQISMYAWNDLGSCFVDSSDPNRSCGLAPAGAVVNLDIVLGWLDGSPGPVTVADDCGGTVALDPPAAPDRLLGTWTAPAQSGVTCTVTIEATNAQGVASQLAPTVQIF